ncbi:MAG: mercuric transporter MerT family protein [Phycisphaerae bacterium]
MTNKTPSLSCQHCGQPARPVRAVTLQSLMRDDRQSEITSDSYYVCATPGCSTVYFNEAGQVFDESALRVRFGLKGAAKPMTICYCFDYSVEDIHQELAQTGQTTVPECIKRRIKEEGCRCERTNPLGRCCLETVRAAIDEAGAAPSSVGGAADCTPSDCCNAGESTKVMANASGSSQPRTGMWAVGGSVVSAALSSACCWLPLLLIAFGASAAGVAGFFERWRTPFIGGAVALLGVGYYMTYKRPARCGDTCCDGTPGRVRRFNKLTLWMATAVVGAMVLFPSYVGTLLGQGESPGSASVGSTGTGRMVLEIEGMTCEGCAAPLRGALTKVPGVRTATVDYATSSAIVGYDLKTPVDQAVIRQAVKNAGYSAKFAGSDSTGPVAH